MLYACIIYSVPYIHVYYVYNKLYTSLLGVVYLLYPVNVNLSMNSLYNDNPLYKYGKELYTCIRDLIPYTHARLHAD